MTMQIYLKVKIDTLPLTSNQPTPGEVLDTIESAVYDKLVSIADEDVHPDVRFKLDYVVVSDVYEEGPTNK